MQARPVFEQTEGEADSGVTVFRGPSRDTLYARIQVHSPPMITEV